MFKTITGKIKTATKKTWIIVAGATGVVAVAVAAVLFPAAAIGVLSAVRGALQSAGKFIAGIFSPADAVAAAEEAGGAAETATDIANAIFA